MRSVLQRSLRVRTICLAHDARERREDELGGLGLALGPLGNEPEGLAIDQGYAVVVCRLDADEGEARLELGARAISPGHAPERLAREGGDKLLHRLALGVDAIDAVETDDAEGRQHADGEVEPQLPNTVAKLRTVAVRAVGQHDASRSPIANGALDHLERELDLGLERDIVGDARLVSALPVIGPHFGQVQVEVDGDLLGTRRDGQADADLAVGDLARRAGVLSLNADRMGTLLEEPRVVDDPRRDRLSLLDGLDRVASGLTAARAAPVP